MKQQLMRSVVAALVLNGALGAQAKPDFTGTWQMDVARSESVAQGVPVSPTVIIIAQTPSAVRIETRTEGNSAVQTFRLENVDNPRPVGTSGSQDAELSWDGDTLVTTTQEIEKGMTMTRTKRRTLDPTGKIMIVVTTLTIHHAYATSTAKDVFNKVE